MRLRRAAFFGLMAAMLLLLMYSGETIFLWVVLAQIMALAVAGLSLLHGVLCLGFSQSLTADSAVKGERVALRILLENNGFLPLPYLRVWYRTIDGVITGEESSAAMPIMPRSSAVLETDIACSYRGVHDIGLTRFEVRDLFGLLAFGMPFARYSFFKPARLLVFPRISYIPRQALLNFELEGHVTSRDSQVEELSSVAEIRAWRPGDPLKRAHWKLTARNRAVLIKTFDGTSRPDACLFINCGRHGLPPADALELEDVMLECAASFCRAALDAWQPVRMITYAGERIEQYGNDPTGFPAFYSRIASLRFIDDLAFEEEVRAELDRLGEQVGSIVIITPPPSNDLYNYLIAMAGADAAITVVIAALPGQMSLKLERMPGKFAENGVDSLIVSPGDDITEKWGAL